MLGVLYARPKPWILPSLAHFHGASSSSLLHHCRLSAFSAIHFSDTDSDNPRLRRHHSSACTLVGSVGGASSIWHVIQPSGFQRRSGDARRFGEPRGEGSWNVAWDARPARWLHRSDSVWLLFGVCACLAPSTADELTAGADEDEEIGGGDNVVPDEKSDGSADYTVTGVVADGRCLFRAIAHGACLARGEEAPDESRQRELADQLRAQVVDELLKRREEIEWFIEEDFDAYIKRIQQPYVWGGEPELLMACHVLKTTVSVFMIDGKSGDLVNIANYGEEYRNKEVNPINVLFHGYGHYDILETSSCQSYQKMKV